MRGALLAQYLRVKAEQQHAILLFRLGDFYEMFFDDAVTASRVCDLTLTARNRGEPDEVPLCGFPAHASQPYVARLLAACLRRDPKNRPTASQARRALRDLTPKLSSVSFPLGAPPSSLGNTGSVAAAGAPRVARAQSA